MKHLPRNFTEKAEAETRK